MMQADSFPLPLVMRRPLVALHVFDSVSVALDAAQEHGVHHFPICDGERLLGMVCTCDLQEVALESAVGELMRPAVTLPASSTTTDAAQLMRAADVGSVFVTDLRGAPCGIVTRGDLSGEPPVAAILEDCRCEACGTHRHLHRYGDQQLCFSCHERVAEPQAFETGGGD